MQTAQACKDILLQEGINPLSSIDFDVNGETYSLTLEYIIDTYMQGSQNSQLVFYTALEKSRKAGEMGVEKFFEGMGQLLLMSHLSDKFK